MSAVCSRCNHVFDHAPACPLCGLTTPVHEAGPTPVHGPRWQQSAWGRILIGLILSQGLFYGLRHLLTGLLLAAEDVSAEELWSDVGHLLVLQGIQLLGVLIGGTLAGGGQRSGLFLGAVVGAWNGVLAVLLRQNPAQELTLIGLFGQPLLHAFIGCLGGALGSLIWKPIPAVAVPLALAPPRKPVPRRKSPFLAGKIHFVRILLGAVIAVAGTMSASMVFKKALDLSDGKLATTHATQDQLITWELKALMLIAGGALAGATTTNGLKQGLFVGVAATAVLIGLQAPAADRWAEVGLYTTISTLTLCMAGGWFGGALFPPVVKLERRSFF